MTIVSPMGQLRPVFADKNGKRLSGGKVFTYEPGTLTPKATYTDALNLIPNTNPIDLDKYGEADIFLNGDYRIRVVDRHGVLIDDYDNLMAWATKRYLDLALSGLASGASKFYPTLAGANADIANIAVNQVVNIGELENGGLWFKESAESTTLTKVPYDTLELAKQYSNQKQVVQEQYINDLFAAQTQNIENLINQQGVALDQLDDYYNYLMERLAQIAVDKGWDANFVVDSSGRSQQQINNDYVNVKNYGAIGDNTLHTVQEWTVTGSRIYYPNLAAIQVDYPHVTSLSDSIDWAAIQKALDTGRDVVGPPAHYHINKSLYIKKTHQQFKDLGFIRMDASLAKPVLYLGAKDTNGTKSDEQVWFSEISGTSFHGFGNRSEGSAGLSLVSCSQCKIYIDARGFHAGIRVDGVCIINTFFQPILLQNTYGLYDPLGHPTISDIQASAFFGGRIEQNEREGIYSASPNIKFIGCCIEGNGKFNGSDGTAPEVTILSGPTSGSVTFTECYMESLNDKTAKGTIVIAPMATRSVKINSGEYFGGETNKDNIVLVEIASPASTEMSVNIVGASLSAYKNYGRGTISANSQFVAIACRTRETLVLWSDVLTDSTVSRPLIEQSDRNYYYSNQNQRIRQITASGPISTTDTVTATGTATAAYFIGTSDVIGLSAFNGFYQQRHKKHNTGSATPIIALSSELPEGSVYLLEIKAVGRATATESHTFKASLLINRPAGQPPIIAWQDIEKNSKTGQTLVFSIDSNSNLVVTATEGASLNGYIYRFFVAKCAQS